VLVDACSLPCAESDVSSTASSLDTESLVVSSSRVLDSGFSSLRGLDGGVSSLRGLDGGGVPLLSAWAFATWQQLWIYAPADDHPRIIVPPSCQEALIRDVRAKMFHLSYQKVAVVIERSYFWPSLRKLTRSVLVDCPECEVNKARQNSAHGLFRALPVHDPRAGWCMDFQGQGEAETGEKEAPALIDPTSRYVVVLPLKDREAATWLQLFLDAIVFKFGPPEILHSDAASEFLSEAVQLLARAADIHTTTTMGHYARGNGTIEIFLRFWNRCLRFLRDDHYKRWPAFASRITFAYIAAPHDSIGGVTPFEVFYGVPSRPPFANMGNDLERVDEDKELQLPALFAEVSEFYVCH
jgi:hypothetical protein